MKRVAFSILASLGVLIWLVEIGLHVTGRFTGHVYELDHVVLLVGGVMGFVGFFGLDPKRTKEGAKVILDTLPRFGRRASDAVAIPGTKTTTEAVPVRASVPVVVGADVEKDEQIERPKFPLQLGSD